MRQDRLVERALDAALEGAVQIGQPEHLFVVVARMIDVARELDRGLGERPRLVGAQHIHGAEIVDRGETLDDDAVPSEPLCPIGQRHRDDHGQQLRGETDREREREQQRFEERAVEHHVGRHDEQHEEDREPQHQEAELTNAARECVPRPFGGEPLREPAELRLPPGAAHHCCRRTADGGGSHEHEVRSSRRLVGWRRKIGRSLLHRVRLAREQSLIDEQVVRREQAAIAWHDVAGAQLDDVARHELIDGDVKDLATAQRLCPETDRAPERIDRVLGACLLHDIEHNAQQDDDDDDDEARHLSGPRRKTAGKEQDEDQGIGKAIENLPPQRAAPLRERVIWAVLGEALPGRFVAEPAGSCIEQTEQPVQRQVPRQALGYCGTRVYCGTLLRLPLAAVDHAG